MGNTTRHIILVAITYLAISIAATAQSVWYVDRDSSHPHPDGESWNSAFPTIQPAIDAAYAGGGGEVWIAEGTYDELRTSVDSETGLNTGSIVMRDGVGLYGGFAGTEEFRHERNTLLHRTIIDASTARNGEPAYNAILAASNIVLDGLEITGAIALHNDHHNGAGLFADLVENISIRGCVFHDLQSEFGAVYLNRSENVSIERSAFIDNSSPWWYGAPALAGFQTSLRIVDTQFVGNEFPDDEGDFYAVVLLHASQVEMRRCRFSQNAGTPLNIEPHDEYPASTIVTDSDFIDNQGLEGYGAFIFYGHQNISGLEFERNVVSGNTSVSSSIVSIGGNGPYNAETFTQNISIRNCVFTKNQIEAGLPIFLVERANFTFEHCTFADNTSTYRHWYNNAGGVLMHASRQSDDGAEEKLHAYNSIFWNEIDEYEFNPEYDDYTFPVIDDSIVRTGYAGNQIYTAEPEFLTSGDGDFRLAPGSAGVDYGQLYDAPEADILGTPRPVGEFVDVGAFEASGIAPLCAVANRVEEQFTHLPFAADELTDLDNDGLPELASLRLLAEAACEYGTPENLSVAAAYEANFTAANTEPFDMRVLRNREMIAALMSVSESAQSTLRDALAELGVVLLNDYVVVGEDARGEATVHGPVSGPADYDGDGMSNADEWASVLADEGTIDDFVAAASDPTVRGSTETHVNASCFIATAAYGTTLAAELQPLRNARDTHLLTNPFGAAFTDVYYRVGPPIANFVAQHEDARKAVRAALAPIISVVKWWDSENE